MRAGWQLNKLGEIYDVRDGTHDSPKYQATGFPLITSKNLKEGELSFANVNLINELDYNKINERSRVHKGDILFAMIGTIGNPTLVTVEPNFAIKNVALLKIPPAQSGAFLKYYLDSEVVISKMTKEAKGTTQKFVGLGYLRDFPIPLPPLPEQHRIVAILDTAFDRIATARANCEANLLNARAIFESHLQAVFTQRGDGWVEKKLEELGTITSSKRIFKNEYVPSGVPFYRTKEVKELANGKRIRTELFISDSRYQEIKDNFGVPKKGDILLTAIGTIGEIYVVDGDNDFYFKDGNVLWLKDFKSINSNFLRYVLISFVDSLNKMAHGSAYSALPIHRLNSHKVFLPPLAEQAAIVLQLNALDIETQRLESLYQRKLQALDDLKKSLLHQAFSGLL